MAELSLLLLVAVATGLAIAWPLLDRETTPTPASAAEVDDARAVRHRLALEALRDLEADRRAGSLDDERHAVLRSEAEARAAETLPTAEPAPPEPPRVVPGGRRLALAMGAGLLALLLIGFALPEPVGIAERTVTDQPLADAIAAENARQAEIARLQALIADDPTDPQAFSDLADAYLAGPSFDDQRRGAAALLVVLSLDPENASAYRRLITAYINAADWIDARSALHSYAEIAGPDEPDIPFFRGLIALRGEGDEAEAVRQFDRFLELAPHDPRAGMVLSLREQAAGSE
jgi:cytochrome c-type biogenesis protein CcmI